MSSDAANPAADKTQQRFARLAGFLFLWVLVIAIASGMLLSRVAGDGSFSETARRIAASQHLYRLGLVGSLIVSLSSALLFFSLYAVLKTVNSLLGQLALVSSLLDSSLACVVRASEFVSAHLSVSAQTAGAGTVQAETLAELMRTIGNTTENIGGICFGIGSLIYFYLFFRSRYIPKTLSALGVIASALFTILYFANLVFPEYHRTFLLICFPPLAVTNVWAGFYLLLFGVRARPRDRSLPAGSNL